VEDHQSSLIGHAGSAKDTARQSLISNLEGLYSSP